MASSGHGPGNGAQGVEVRIAVVGGGGAGLASAWLLEEQHDVTLFEADGRLGGHAHTIEIDLDGHPVPIDAGFQFFGPGKPYTTFNRLLAELRVPLRTYSATMSLSRLTDGTHVALPPFRHGRIVWPSLTPAALCDLIGFRRFLTGIPEFLAQRDTTVTIAEYIESRRMPRSFVDGFLYPFLLALWCVDLTQFREFAAYNALFYLGDALRGGLHAPEQVEIDGGMKTYVAALTATLRRTDVRLGARVHRLTREGESWLLVDSTGARLAFDQVVLATNARQAHELVSSTPELDEVSRQLRRIRYFDTTIAVHGDRRLMPRSESVWSVVNARWDGTHSQMSIWNPDRGLPVFRSWVTYEDRLPEPLYATAIYEHALVTVDYFDAQARLKRLRGSHGVWLAGLYADDADSHESAVHSAVTIAEQLAPGSRRLRVLRA
ncbi:FAD-dependent oxidoreductase [Microbacterium sp. B2969]|uniref:FAD-dependent oxidoreductase n=1 Tax=Microbacterium alkaliflavum TaxID=3248839 RepID=A0ABW7QA82_9MICO